MCGCRERWERYSEEEKAEQVLHVVSKLVTEAEDLQETMETRKRQLLLQNGLEWKSFRSYVDITCMYMVSVLAVASSWLQVKSISTDLGVTEGTGSEAASQEAAV